jgi:hypothetical protein
MGSKLYLAELELRMQYSASYGGGHNLTVMLLKVGVRRYMGIRFGA